MSFISNFKNASSFENITQYLNKFNAINVLSQEEEEESEESEEEEGGRRRRSRRRRRKDQV